MQRTQLTDSQLHSLVMFIEAHKAMWNGKLTVQEWQARASEHVGKQVSIENMSQRLKQAGVTCVRPYRGTNGRTVDRVSVLSQIVRRMVVDIGHTLSEDDAAALNCLVSKDKLPE